MNEMRFDGQVAVVTGAGSGLGREYALLLAARGASVIVNDVSDGAEATVAEIVANGGVAAVDHGDVGTAKGARSPVVAAVATYGRIDVVVSNAGIVRDVPFGELDADLFDRIQRVNLYGTFHVVQEAWRHFVEQDYGRVVIVTSAAGLVGHPRVSAYATSKGGVVGLGKSIALEVGDHDIKVNMLAPAAYTPMTALDPVAETADRVAKMMPARLVAPAVAWLAHRDVTVNGVIVDAAAGRVGLDFIGMTRGYWNPELTMEDIATHVVELLDRTGYVVPSDTMESSAFVLETAAAR